MLPSTDAPELDAQIYRKIKAVKSSKLAQQKTSAPYSSFFNSMHSPHLDTFLQLKKTFYESVSSTTIDVDLVSKEYKYINFVLRHGRNNNRKFLKLIVLAWENNMWTSVDVLNRVQFFGLCIFTL